jgi:murein DD-endopeptidase MepM/ murein hydrolase activator NlpD
MSSVVELVRSWPLPRVLALAVIAAGAAACSSEATRFNSNPYASQQEATGSIQQRAPSGSVQTSSLPPPNGGQSPDPAVTASVQAPAQSPHSLPPPVRQSASVHVVAPGETLTRIARMYNTSLTDLARLNNIPPHTKVNMGDRITIPANHTARVARPEPQKVAQSKSLNTPAKGKTEAKALPKGQAKSAPVLASHQPTETASVATPNDATATTNAVRAGNASLSFRWPAKGRIIAGFGPKTNGQSNDGINIALPEGTPVKAAEDGVVAYAGNELKGYGNLVLVRHADGYVTAYAHAKELMVKRGDPIKRGQTIARSGQTGNVDAPQLHFEIRKGPAPIDPMPHLSGG